MNSAPVSFWGRWPPAARLWRSLKRFQAEQLADRAGALTYYAVLSLFPGLALLVSILGVFGTQGTVDALLEVVDEMGPRSAVDTLREPIEQIARKRDGAGFVAVVSLVGTLWAASGYLGAFGRAADRVRGEEDTRRFYVSRPFELGLTLAIVVLTALVLSAMLLTGPIAGAVGRALELDSIAVTLWAYAKWPVLFALISGAVALLYWSAGRRGRGGLREVLPGAALATALLLIASLGFSLYIRFFGSYDATYGSLGAVIIFLVWVWLVNASIVLGIVYNSER